MKLLIRIPMAHTVRQRGSQLAVRILIADDRTCWTNPYIYPPPAKEESWWNIMPHSVCEIQLPQCGLFMYSFTDPFCSHIQAQGNPPAF